MKKIIVIASAFLAFACNQTEPKKDAETGKLTIELSGEKFPDEKIYLLDYQYVKFDSVEVGNKTEFSFDVKNKENQIIFVGAKKIEKIQPIFIAKENLTTATITTSSEGKITTEVAYPKNEKQTYEAFSIQETFNAFLKNERGFEIEEDSLMTAFFELRSKYDPNPIPESEREAIDNAFDKLAEKQSAYYEDISKDNSDLLGIYLVLDRKKEFETHQELKDFIAKIPKELHQEVYYQEVVKLEEKLSHLQIGSVAPEIEKQTPSGEKLALSSLRGKFVLVDFWASWCGPCRAESPYLVKAYNRFKSKGFDIYSISLDYPKGGKEKWEAAIKKDGLIWNHVSDLNGWNDPTVKQYDVYGVPTLFLLDREGKIVAKGDEIRGENLIPVLEKLIK